MTVDADSILAVMTLGAAHGDTVTLTADDEATLDSLAELLATDLDAS
jgi:phosphocarrier protein